MNYKDQKTSPDVAVSPKPTEKPRNLGATDLRDSFLCIASRLDERQRVREELE